MTTSRAGAAERPLPCNLRLHHPLHIVSMLHDTTCTTGTFFVCVSKSLSCLLATLPHGYGRNSSCRSMWSQLCVQQPIPRSNCDQHQQCTLQAGTVAEVRSRITC